MNKVLTPKQQATLKSKMKAAKAMFLSWRTGEAFFDVKPQNFSDALDAILMQVHFRYGSGFSPGKLDGERHALRVELSAAGKKKFKDSVLKARPEYIPAN